MTSAKAAFFLTFFIAVITARAYSAPVACMFNNYLNYTAGSNTFYFDLGTSGAYTPSPNSILLYQHVAGCNDPVGTSRYTVRVNNSYYDMSLGTNSLNMHNETTDWAYGRKKYGNAVTVYFHSKLVVNPATGINMDTMQFMFVLINDSSSTVTTGFRLELDTQVGTNDGAKISVDNGNNQIDNNNLWTAASPIPYSYWAYDQGPKGLTPTTVARGYLWGNSYGEPATPPDEFEVADWNLVNGIGQWSYSAAGSITADSAVVLWWNNGGPGGTGYQLSPGQGIVFITYYGINQEPLFVSPTATYTQTPTFTITSTYTPSYTRSQTSTATATLTGTATSTGTATYTATYSVTVTYTPTYSPTGTCSAEPSNTHTASVSRTVTSTFTNTITGTPSKTPTLFFSATVTQTDTLTETITVTRTLTLTLTPTETLTATQTVTVSPVHTATMSHTVTQTASVTMTYTPVPVVTSDILEVKGSFPSGDGGSTHIVYWLGNDAEVTIRVFTVSGELVCEAAELQGKKGYNSYEWDLKNRAKNPVASGVFIYRVKARFESEMEAVALSKMAVIK